MPDTRVIGHRECPRCGGDARRVLVDVNSDDRRSRDPLITLVVCGACNLRQWSGIARRDMLTIAATKRKLRRRLERPVSEGLRARIERRMEELEEAEREAQLVS